MMAWLLNEIKSPEFWTSMAFLGVVLIFMRPFMRYLDRWAKKQAALVQKNREEARSVRKRAETVLKQYEAVNRNRETERGRLLAEADEEISFLEQEFEQRTADRIARKKQEMALRLKTIEENGRQDVKNKMLNRIVGLARKDLMMRQSKGELQEDMVLVVDRVCQAMDDYAVLLRK